MFNLFDILQAQNGPGLQDLGQQFGLSPDQTRRAMEALLPAFSLGLQHNAVADPMGFGQLFGLAGMNPGGRPAPPSQADQLVQQIFGSPHLSQAVINQASTASGLASPVLRQMLPILAGMVVTGIVHVMVNQNQGTPGAQPAAGGATPYGFPAGAYWTDMMKAWNPTGTNPAPNRTATLVPSRPAPARKGPAAGAPQDTPYDMFQQMFQTGIDAQQENVKAMQGLFDAFWTMPASPSTDEATKTSGTKPNR